MLGALTGVLAGSSTGLLTGLLAAALTVFCALTGAALGALTGTALGALTGTALCCLTDTAVCGAAPPFPTPRAPLSNIRSLPTGAAAGPLASGLPRLVSTTTLAPHECNVIVLGGGATGATGSLGGSCHCSSSARRAA